MTLLRTGRAYLWRRAEEYVHRAVARAETDIAGHALERVREATGVLEGGAEVEAWDRVRWAAGSLVGARGGGTLGGWRPLGVGI